MFKGTLTPFARCYLWSLAAVLIIGLASGQATAGRDRRVLDFAAACRDTGARGVISASQAQLLIAHAAQQFVRTEGDPPSGVAHVDEAHELLGEIYLFLHEVLALDSIDNRGGALVAVVGARFQGDYDWPQCVGDAFNAAWVDSSFVLLANDALPLVEVVAHEIAHGVIDHGSRLVYRHESGALNEAISDALGVAFRAWRRAGGSAVHSPTEFAAFNGLWRLRKPGGVIRDMREPKSVHPRYPDHYDDYVRLPAADDHGGVHINSSIINQAFYLLSEGGRHPRLGGEPVAQGVGIKAAVKIYSLAAAHLLTERSDFADARAEFARAAGYLYGGKHSAAWVAVHQAMDAVGVPGDWQRAPATPSSPPVAVAAPPAAASSTPATPPPISPGGGPATMAPPSTSSLLWLYAAAAGLLLFALFYLLRRMRPDYGADAARVVRRDARPPATPRPTPVAQPAAAVKRADESAVIGNFVPTAGGPAIALPARLLTAREGLVIGRNPALCHVVIEDGNVSRRHLRLRLRHGAVVIEDLNSTNGSSLDGKALSPFVEQTLAKGGVVALAGIEYVFRA